MAWVNVFDLAGGAAIYWRGQDGVWHAYDSDPFPNGTAAEVSGVVQLRTVLAPGPKPDNVTLIAAVPNANFSAASAKLTVSNLDVTNNDAGTPGTQLAGIAIQAPISAATDQGPSTGGTTVMASLQAMPLSDISMETNPGEVTPDGADTFSFGPNPDGGEGLTLLGVVFAATGGADVFCNINSADLVFELLDPTSDSGGAAPPPAGKSATNFNCECEGGPASKTLKGYRRDLLIRCGFAAVADNPPPGTPELMNAFLQDAQNFLYMKYPALHTRRFFRWTMEEGVRFYGMLENDDSTRPRVPVTFSADVVNTLVITWAGYDAPPAGRGVFFTTPSEDDALPYGLLPDTMYYVVGVSGGTSNIALTPGGTALTVALENDTAGVSHGYAEIRQAIFDLSPYKDIEGAWLVDLNGSWLPMTFGIPPVFYTTVTQPGLPVRLEIRQCIEVFPAPSAAYTLYIKGHFGLRPFELDGDKPTIDGTLVYLWALANALDYYGKPSAAGIAAQAREHLGSLTAGTHTGKRYVPGTRPLPPAIIPSVTPPFPSG